MVGSAFSCVVDCAWFLCIDERARRVGRWHFELDALEKGACLCVKCAGVAFLVFLQFFVYC